MNDEILREIRASGLFDERWYQSAYPDVALVDITPIEHYLRFGGLMGRLPSLAFDTRRYLEMYPDVLAAGVNPLVHYVRYGRQEGRYFSHAKVALREHRSEAAANPRPLPLTVLVLTWDIGHNPLGRSYMLADVLDRIVRTVVIAGFQFERYGSDIWEPVRDGRLPVVSLRGRNFPDFLHDLERFAARVKPDIVFACKPRLPSFQLGAMIKKATGCPLVLDIDDHELSFFRGSREIGLHDLALLRADEASSLVEPYGEKWTCLTQGLRGLADQTIVSNAALQRLFGGVVVPHVRDETVFDPTLHDKNASRRSFGIPPDAKVVLFFGTPRQHKGVDVLARAVAEIQDPSFLLVVVGSAPDASVTAKLSVLAGGKVVFLPNQPFDRIPDILAMADVVCLPQDTSSPISAYQLPAKAIDAVAMGIPLLVAGTAPLLQLVEDGVAQTFDPDRLPTLLQEAARNGGFPGTRARFVDRYSYDSAARTLRAVITQAMSSVDSSSISDIDALVSGQKRLFGGSPDQVISSPEGQTIVMFWKQNDSGIYGRRSDMVMRYLASRPDIARIIMFDAPISEHELKKLRDHKSGLTHHRQIYVRTYQRSFGGLDCGKLSFDVFIHAPGQYRTSEDGSGRSHLRDAIIEHVHSAFLREGIDPRNAVFWFYPRIRYAEELVRHFKPAKVVVDVVDDHRTWPGTSDEQRQSLTTHYRNLLSVADMAFANCSEVAEAMRPFSPEIRVVPNGCDDQIVLQVPKSSEAYEKFSAHQGKIIGFVGNLEKKIDIDLIEKVAVRFPDCLVALLGSTHANPEVRRLKTISNVMMPGIVPYSEIAAWVSQFDVGIVPHLDMELTRSMNPLKVYVYLSCGVPVVSTEIANLDRSQQFLKIAQDHESFLSMVQRTLEEGKPSADALADYIVANGWAARFSTHLDELLAPLK